jgi:hypothetical protein
VWRRLRLANNVDVGRGACVPTAMAVAPPDMKGRGGGPLLLTADSAFKLRVHDAATLATTRTVLGPTYGGSLCTLHVFQPHSSSQHYLAYATRQKVDVSRDAHSPHPSRPPSGFAHPRKLLWRRSSNLCCADSSAWSCPSRRC